jgi:NADH dehydrogenase
VPLDRAGRVQVQPDLTIPGQAEVFVIGDLAAATSQGQSVPGVAPAAIQGGRHAARCIRRTLAGQPAVPFHYRHRGALATIGRAAAVADFGWLKLTGFLAWLAWMLVHIAFLVGFRNRVFVLLSWAWAYLTFQRGARLITGAPEQLLPNAPGTDRRVDGPGAALVAPLRAVQTEASQHSQA